MSRSFLDGPPEAGAGLGELQEYLRPKTRQELFHRILQHVAPTTAPTDVRQASAGHFLESVGVQPWDFVEVALNRPELWDNDQLRYLEEVATGVREPDPRLDQMAEDFYASVSAPEPEAAIRERARAAPIEDLEELPQEPYRPQFDDIPTDPVDLSKVEEWWKKL